MSKWKFVIVSKDDKFKMGPEKFTEAMNFGEFNMSYVDNNTKPLAEVYNDYLNYERTRPDGTDLDYIVFMHADVSFNLEGFVKHVDKVAGKYDIIGLCGTAVMNVSQSPLNWFTSSRPTPNKRWGCVMHGELGNQMTWFSQHSPDVGDHEVVCIDGLCIIFAKKAIEDRAILFDPSVGAFDFYDSDISMQAMMRGLRLGVVVRKDLMHFSVGRSILTKHFLENELKFREKWSLPIPENSPLKQLNLMSDENQQPASLTQVDVNLQSPGQQTLTTANDLSV